jgi:predicted signal transduction protein with EAL and GGDEF domain
VAAATLLRALGCTYGQGFHFGRPLPGDQVGRLLQSAALPPAGLDPAAASGRSQAEGIGQRA